MKIKFLRLLFALMLALTAGAMPTALAATELRPLPQQGHAAHLTAELLGHYHYRPVSFDAVFSEKIFAQYLKALDAEKAFFVQSDIDQWTDARGKLREVFLKEDLAIPFAVFNRYCERAEERFTYARTLLKQGFDFTQNENYRYRRDKEPWLRSEDEARELWRKRVKNDWLELKLAGKDDGSIVDTLDRRYENFLKRLARYKSENVFQIFMEAAMSAVDPHRWSHSFGTSSNCSVRS